MSIACYRFLPFPSPNHLTGLSIAVSTKKLRTRKPITYALDPNVTDVDHRTSFQDYQSLFVSQRSETKESVSLVLVEGSIPSDFPNGTYYLAGPGIFSDDHGPTVNPLDGHGYLRAFQFGNGSVSYSAKYVKTEAQREERDDSTGEWKFVYRGPFSVLLGANMFGNMKVMKNVANTSVGVWGHRLLCFWEGGNPHQIDPVSLDTVGEVDLLVNHNRNYKMGMDFVRMFLKHLLLGVFKMSEKRLLSHYKIDSKRKRLIVLSCNYEDILLPIANFSFYEFDSDFKLVEKKEFSIADHLLIHDWCFTENHYIIVGNRIKNNGFGPSFDAVMGHSPMISTLAVNTDQQTSPVYLLPRFGRTTTGRDWQKPIQLPKKMWVIHVGNGFEEIDESGNGIIQFIASASSYEWFKLHKLFGYDWRSGNLDPSFYSVVEGGRGEEKESISSCPHLFMVSIKLIEGISSLIDVSRIWNRPADFPTINQIFSGGRNNYVYASTTVGNTRRPFLPHFPFDSLVKLDLSNGSMVTWSADDDRGFVGEPIFIPRKKSTKEEEEDDGYIVTVEYAISKKMCYLVILDASCLGEVVAKIEIPKNLTFPLGFHGFWAEK
ncbi:Carotenoid cleavage dioxygenase 7 [Zostera marina]|uniref:Carotenoid cleavage dioxygenase 7 n=1 Tax=Zostera marina TaxID=29655 RepID=A0A0K9PPD4_ZOSMR|nr:Carotenoid cleavage dioxygenase 7 [Zostera marina]